MTIGASPYTNIRPDALLALDHPADDTLTSWQDLPFEWSFYGTQVTGYRASDNGYITFDASQSISNPFNTGLPSTYAPRNAIFAFWDSLKLAEGASMWSNEIRTKTFGVAPNRVHVVMWVSVTPTYLPAAGSLSFAVALHEGGDFEIVQIAGRPGGRTTGTIGVQGDDSVTGMMLPGSPSLTYPPLTASGDDDIVYHFTWASERRNAAMLTLDIPSSVKVGSSFRPSGRIVNAGADTVTSLVVYCQVGTGPTWSKTLGPLELAGNDNLAWTLDDTWIATLPGDVTTVTAWVDLDGDQKRIDDTLRARTLTILGRTAERRPLIEEFTGAWCGWCPDGALQMDSIEMNLPSAVLVSIHAGPQPDMMKTATGLELTAAYLPSFPQAMIDRHRFDGETDIPLDRTNSSWQTRARERIADGSPMTLDVLPSFDPSSRSVMATVSVNCVDYIVADDYRIHVYILEDEVSGEGLGWDQANYFSGNEQHKDHPFYLLPNPLPGYTHRRVLRGSLTGTWGDSGDVPLLLKADTSYSYLLTGVLGDEVNPSRARLVAFVSRHGELLADREVINAAQTPVVPAGLHTRGTGFQTLNPGVVPNPARSRCDLHLQLSRPSPILVTLFDVQGRQISTASRSRLQAGNHIIPIDLTHAVPGVYLLAIQGEETIESIRVLVH